ncbi:hypothetical protein THRCLA_05830 [Thraustotheca clavata]|uniref:Uncharacterized protein n=1 Tax=Thraustotheca clavata TaxID=74557 RepID=A0A1V9ZSA1_9STRA|nr:hypothetical protein THRCLA_05830 [Thraustotheca clavata]
MVCGAGRELSMSWVVENLVNLFTEYPDGITYAIAITEMMVRYKLDRTGDVKNESITTELVQYEATRHTLILALTETEEDCFDGNRKLAHMFLHQRFERFAGNGNVDLHPFNAKRRLLLTNLQRFEKRNHTALWYLPTDFMVFEATLSDPWDKGFYDQALCLSTLTQWQQIPTELIHLQCLRMKIVEVLSTRPCVSSAALRRQSIVVSPVKGDGASFLFVLWDQQIMLSQLLQPGDLLIVDSPFLHECDSGVDEHAAIFSEVPSYVRVYPKVFLEYGSSTVIFRVPAVIQKGVILTQRNETLDIPKEEHTKFSNLTYYPYLLSFSKLPPKSVNGSVLGMLIGFEIIPTSSRFENFCATYYGVRDINRFTCVVATIRDLQGEQAIVQVDCVGSIAREILQCQIGHVIFMQGVVFIESQNEIVGLCTKWRDLLQSETQLKDGVLANWSRLTGFLSSPDFYQRKLLAAPLSHSTIASFTIVQASFATNNGVLDNTCENDDVIVMIHDVCNKPCQIDNNNVYSCSSCNKKWTCGDISWTFKTILLEVEDGSTAKWIVADPHCATLLFGVDPLTFDQFTYERKRQFLTDLHGKQTLGMLSLCPVKTFEKIQVTQRLDIYRTLESSLSSVLHKQIQGFL